MAVLEEREHGVGITSLVRPKRRLWGDRQVDQLLNVPGDRLAVHFEHTEWVPVTGPAKMKGKRLPS